MRRKILIAMSVLLVLLLLIPLAFATSQNPPGSSSHVLITMTSSYTPTTLPEGERPPAPTPLSPGHRAHTTDSFPIFFWSPVNGAVNYRIMVFDHKLATERTVDIRQNTTNTFITLSTPLEPDRYFWRVRARAQGAWSRWRVRFTLWIDPILPTPTSTPPPVPTVTPSLTSGQPDLYVQSARIELQNGTVCDTWGTGVDIYNQGDAAAGPFHVLVDGVELSVPGLAAGQTAYVWKSGTANPTNITVDSQGEVSESNEANNGFSMMLPIPTLPIECTWTDTPTPTPGGVTDTPTPTPTPTGTTTPLPDLLVHYVTNGLRPPCLEAPMAVEFGVTNWGNENVPSFVYSVNGTQVPLITPIPPQATLRVIHEDAERNVVNSGHITVILDPLDAIPEWNEANNIGTAFPLTLTPPASCP
ncbi:MAG: hypothetical protein L0154_10560 [Chloroflexi bacterium]|nr:hypothetical protein [Chloroflexota bacterium]